MKKTESVRREAKGTAATVRLTGMRLHEKSDEGAHAGAGRAGSVAAAKRAKQLQMRTTIRGAHSSGEVRGTTLGARPGVRAAGSASAGTIKPGIRRGSRRARAI